MSLLKKIALAVTIVSISASLAAAQDWAASDGSCYQKGAKEAHAGLLVPHIGLYGALDYGFHQAISGGINVGYYTYNYGYTTYDWSYHFIPVTAYAALHLQNLTVLKDILPMRDKLDIYAGLGIGYNYGYYTWPNSVSGRTETVMASEPVLREHAGIKYFFAPNMAVFLEDAGFEQGLGIAFKF